ncbi:MAG: hypothetical protein RH981_14120 [Arenibacter sp.]
MTIEEQAAKILQTVKDYLSTSTEEKVPAKDLMPLFIKKGIFPKDHRNGLPIREILRKLDRSHQLHLIPYVYPERKAKNTNWFFAKVGYMPSSPTPKKENSIPKPSNRADSDEKYVIDLCDKVLSKKASRQHTFNFLFGDIDSRGQKRKLPVDAYYPDLNMVIEYREQQHSESVPHFDKPTVRTISGVNRGEQRKIYDQRRRDVLEEHKIKLIEIEYSDFEYNGRKKIVRDLERDLSILQRILKNYI